MTMVQVLREPFTPETVTQREATENVWKDEMAQWRRSCVIRRLRMPNLRIECEPNFLTETITYRIVIDCRGWTGK